MSTVTTERTPGGDGGGSRKQGCGGVQELKYVIRVLTNFLWVSCIDQGHMSVPRILFKRHRTHLADEGWHRCWGLLLLPVFCLTWKSLEWKKIHINLERYMEQWEHSKFGPHSSIESLLRCLSPKVSGWEHSSFDTLQGSIWKEKCHCLRISEKQRKWDDWG